jgi:sulfur carrier protein
MTLASTLATDAIPEMALTVNGAERRVAVGFTVADLLASLRLDPRAVVIERNGTILRDRASLAMIQLAPDDTLEIVHFVGGG